MKATEPPTPGQDEAALLGLVRELVAQRHTIDRAAAAALDSTFDRDLGLDSLGVTELLSRVCKTRCSARPAGWALPLRRSGLAQADTQLTQ